METMFNTKTGDHHVKPTELILIQNNLRTLSAGIIMEHAAYTGYLDLSHNHLKTLDWLYEFKQLKQLVLDCNGLHEAHLRVLSSPMPQLEVLMLNKNEFGDLHTTIGHIKRLFPNLIYLSLHGNPICPDGLELKPFAEYVPYDYDYYRRFILDALTKLKFLDHAPVERTYRYVSFMDDKLLRRRATDLRQRDDFVCNRFFVAAVNRLTGIRNALC